MKQNYFNKIILGTAHFDKKYGLIKKKFKLSEYFKILNRFKKKKIKIIFDTSLGYKESFKILKKFKNYDFNINHKIMINEKDIEFKKKIISEINTVKKTLKIKKINSILLHDEKIINTKTFKKVYNFLIELKKKNYCKFFGYSIYDFPTYKKNIYKYKPDILQIPFNVVDDRINLKDFNLLKKKKILVQARSIFLQGLLLVRYKRLPKKFKRFTHYWKNFDKKFSYNQIKKETYLISYAFSNNYINNVILGHMTLKQIDKLSNLKKKQIIKFPLMKKSEKIFLTNPAKWLNFN